MRDAMSVSVADDARLAAGYHAQEQGEGNKHALKPESVHADSSLFIIPPNPVRVHASRISSRGLAFPGVLRAGIGLI